MSESNTAIDLASKPSKKLNMKKRLAIGLTSFFIIGASIFSIAAPSSATVPNRFYCNPDGGWCYQVNGPYYPGVGEICHWYRNATNTSGTKYYTTCPQPWGPDRY